MGGVAGGTRGGEVSGEVIAAGDAETHAAAIKRMEMALGVYFVKPEK